MVTGTADNDGNPINVSLPALSSVRATGNDPAQAFTDQLTTATSNGPYTSPESQQTAQGAQTRTGVDPVIAGTGQSATGAGARD
ncbi:hypothetical protein GPOL_c49070 [Gordonia polyisoprenivorans VH2]|uniref:Uncharacterized protein n=1 Tax=Gordonia polyisoprenivorans (strain DSM 44266 / VH2) TaxID=1112204 RepID=H6N229_GORPV|nr:hypothetical protein GPOL_c49070 [Gordonia polyisoprenivorans VH2]